MAAFRAKAFLATLFLSLLVLNLVHAAKLPDQQAQAVSGGYPGKILSIKDCGAACAVRCSLSSRPRLCQRACGTCCGRCKCVPPGTYGNYDSCPCYGNMTTRGNRRKCP